jgi:hypothetical protein
MFKKYTILDHDICKFKYNEIKGRLAEHIIQEMLIQFGLEIFKFGMENTLPRMVRLVHRKSKNSEEKFIRNMPDFVMYNPKTEHFYLLEVKFRKKGIFTQKDFNEFKKKYPKEDIYLALVSVEQIIFYKILKDDVKLSEGFEPHKILELETDISIFKKEELCNFYQEVVGKFFMNLE